MDFLDFLFVLLTIFITIGCGNLIYYFADFKKSSMLIFLGVTFSWFLSFEGLAIFPIDVYIVG